MTMRHYAACVLTVCGMMPVARAGDLDILRRMQEADLPAAGALADQMMTSPGSAYSTVVEQPRFTNELAWIDVLDSLPGPPSETDVLAEIALDLGLTRARPGIDVVRRDGFRDPFVAASATKAGVDADIFWHMLDLGGFRHSARSAPYAVALQDLRQQIADVPASLHAANGIDASVLARMMAARNWGEVEPYDLDYLNLMAQHALIHRRPRVATHAALPPMAYRVARLAAAWRDTEGYLLTPPCHRDGSPRVPAVQDGDVPCFVAATDRAVHRWYIGELRRQAALPPPAKHENGMARLLAAVGLLMPLLDLAALAEVVEATVADDLVADGAMESTEAEAAERRAAALTCRIPE
jgi:hypothetical protein